jgi:hypothetical protein
MMQHTSKALIFFLMGLSFAAPSMAAGPSEPNGWRDIASCREISKSKARLRCFDRATRFLDETLERAAQATQTESQGGKDTTSVAALPVGVNPTASYDAEEVDPDASFGAENLVKKDRNRKKQLRAIATSITTSKSGKYIIVLENGQVWRQISGDTNKLRVRRGAESGQEVVIKKRSLGAHALLLSNSKLSILVRRVK